MESSRTMTKILLVEDNELNRECLARLLVHRGFAVVCAEDGETALELAQAAAPDLILMDINLPGMDGFQATQAIRACPSTQGVPVIALTAHAMTMDREKAFQAGCNAYETKPVELSRLLETIEKLL